MTAKKIKQIMPSLKEKKRYIAYDVIAEAEPSPREIEQAITKRMLSFVGELGVSQAGILFPKPGIVRVSHLSAEYAKAALALVKEINGKPVALRSLGTSGMLNKAEKYLAH